MSLLGNPITSVAFLTDQFSGNGSTTVFTMSVVPANTASILVAVSGVVQDPSTYSVIGTSLTFSAAPPSGTGNVSVRYLGIPASGVTTTAYRTVTEFTATAGQTTFSVPSYTVGYINVYRNGVRLGAADFTATDGVTVVLASGAAAGDLITTESFYVSSVLNAIANTNGSVTQLNLAPNVAGNGPLFVVAGTSQQNLTANVTTKVILNTKVFDTANAFDNTTNYRFQPSVAGYYIVTGHIVANSTASNPTAVTLSFYKNGSPYYGNSITPTAVGVASGDISTYIYLNGSTDYIEMYAYLNGGSGTLYLVGGTSNFLQGNLVKAA